MQDINKLKSQLDSMIEATHWLQHYNSGIDLNNYQYEKTSAESKKK